jgi:hypothetical protein
VEAFQAHAEFGSLSGWSIICFVSQFHHHLLFSAEVDRGCVPIIAENPANLIPNLSIDNIIAE